METQEEDESQSVFKLINGLITGIMKDEGITGDKLVKEGRRLAYEILLKGNTGKQDEEEEENTNKGECWQCSILVADLFTKEAEQIEMLQLLDRLAYSVPHQHETLPFTFGKLDSVLPTPETIYKNKNDPKPYHHYPPQIFHLNTSVKDYSEPKIMYELNFDTFQAKPGKGLLNSSFWNSNENSPVHSTVNTPYSSMGFSFFEQFGQRLTEPRNIKIPKDDNIYSTDIMKSFHIDDLHKSLDCKVVSPQSIWDFALHSISVDLDLWSEAAKSPISENRNFICASTRQMAFWKQTHLNKMNRLTVMSEMDLISHLKYLSLGIESKSFYFDQSSRRFMMRKNLCLEGLHRRSLKCYVGNVLFLGTCYWELNNMVSPTSEHNIINGGFIYQSLCKNLRNYLVWYRLEVEKIFGEELFAFGRKEIEIPGLLSILRDLRTLSKQVETMTKIFVVNRKDNQDISLNGGYLMAHLYNEITNITDKEISSILFVTLKDACDVYFRFIQRFLFEGEIDDKFDEFFIKKDLNYVNSCNKKYWDKGFIINNEEAVPEFLKEIANHILLCGKSVRLLRLCVPDDPFCILLSSDHPQIKTCLSFPEIEEQEQYYSQYRTRCLYVCGEPVNFQSLRLQKDIEKKNLKDLIQLKQAETMDKIIEEHKRLHLTLSVRRRQQFEEQQKAVIEAQLEKRRQRERNLLEDQMYIEYNLAMDKVDELKKNSDKKKVQDYYNEIGEEIERRRQKAEWKIKRLKLDDRRTQMIIGEKMTLSIEKLEKENKQESTVDAPTYNINDENTVEKMETSMSSLELSPEVPIRNIIDDKSPTGLNMNEIEDSSPILIQRNTKDDMEITHIDIENKNSLLAAKEYKSLDLSISPSDIINSNDIFPSSVSEYNIHQHYQSRRQEALKNKLKVLNQEMGFSTNEGDLLTTHEIDDNENIMSQNRTKSRQSKHFDTKLDMDVNRNGPLYDTDACREAVKNRAKVLGHDFGTDVRKVETKSKENLSLDLKKCFNKNLNNSKSSKLENNGLKHEIDLTLKTPTNAECHIMCLPTGSILSPTSAKVNDHESNPDDVAEDGFPFPSFIEEYESQDDEDEDEVDRPDEIKPKPSSWNFHSDYLHVENFQPFGIDMTAENEKVDFKIFKRSFEIEKRPSPYSDVRFIIDLAKKTPLTDVFEAIGGIKDSDSLLKRIESEDIATIITCLKRSIVIPLSYQMELVNNAIIKYFLVNCELYEHLKSLGDYFFLMNGEFAKTICQNLFEKLSTTESPQNLLNFATLHSILDKSFGSSINGYNKYAENLSFIVNNMPLSFHHSSPDVLECLTLSYAVAWPVNIILSSEAMERYGKVFQFLIKLRRISWALDQNSESLKLSLKEEFMVSRDLLRSPQYHTIQLYRHTMSSLIRGLHTYIQSTCLQGSWTEFENDLMNVQTLDDLYSVHVIYIKKVLFRCLLNKRSAKVMKLLNDIFTVILRFHHLLNARCWHIAEDDMHYTHPLFSQMQDFFQTFNKLAKHFHKTITCLSDCGYQPHLVELLTLIDYNGYYSSLKK